MLFSFLFKSTDFIDQQADVGQETKEGVTGQGYIGGGYCSSFRSFDIIMLVIILLQKQWCAILWRRCFLID